MNIFADRDDVLWLTNTDKRGEWFGPLNSLIERVLASVPYDIKREVGSRAWMLYEKQGWPGRLAQPARTRYRFRVRAKVFKSWVQRMGVRLLETKEEAFDRDVDVAEQARKLYRDSYRIDTAREEALQMEAQEELRQDAEFFEAGE